MINKDNYEEMLVRYAEGDLGAGERAAVEAFLEANEWAREELELFLDAPTLMPCAKEFGGEEELRRGVVVQFPWRAFSAAACVALMVGVGVRLWQRPVMEDRLPACPQVASVPAAVEPEGALLAEAAAPAVRPGRMAAREDAVLSPEDAKGEEPVAGPGRMPGIPGQAGSLTSLEEPLPCVEQVGAEEFYGLLAMFEPEGPEDEPWAPAPEELPWRPLEESTLPVVPMEPVRESLMARIEDNTQRIRGIWQHVRNIFSSTTELLLAYNEE